MSGEPLLADFRQLEAARIAGDINAITTFVHRYESLVNELPDSTSVTDLVALQRYQRVLEELVSELREQTLVELRSLQSAKAGRSAYETNAESQYTR